MSELDQNDHHDHHDDTSHQPIHVFLIEMFDKLRSNRSLESESIELFSRDDIRVLSNTSHKSRHQFFNASLLSLVFLLVIGVCALTLIRFTYDLSSVPNTPLPQEIDDNDNESFVFSDKCQSTEPNDRFDCNPDLPISREVCVKRGCCWDQTLSDQKPSLSDRKPPLNVPFCYFGPDFVGYEVKTIENYFLKTVITLERRISSGFVGDSQTVKVEVIEVNEQSVRIKFFDPNERRYEVPIPVLNVRPKSSIEKPLFKVKVTENNVLMIVRRKTSSPVFKTDLKRLVFSNQFLQLSSDLPSEYVYGLGEHKDVFRKSAKEWKRYTFFNRDEPPTEDMNLYGSHPFYLSVEDAIGHSNGVFLFNSDAMDVILQPKPAITWRPIGGILDFFVFLGPEPKDVIRQYQELIGFPHLPPYWALGFHLCRFGYNSLEEMRKVFNRTRSAQIPYDVQWNDIDAMSARKDFSYDDKKFAELPQFVEELHGIGMKYIPIIDPAISAKERPHTYPPYDLGIELGIFIKNSSGQPLVGEVWPGKTVWPDFTNPSTLGYWTQMFEKYHKMVEFDGAWIDMNEPSNFLDGSQTGCPSSTLEQPQYTPGGGDDPLKKKTVCMSGQQFSGLHYDLHNLYGFSEAIVTNVALSVVRQKRPVIISRSTAPGHGKYAGHWDGDVFSTWDQMRWTIPSILNFNLFGIPLIGADICGFNGNTTAELCARWSSLGAFYPFSRNHNSDDTIDQDPVSLGPEVVAAAKSALEWKYSLLPFLYTLFFRAHTEGQTVVRPLFFEFPTDPVSRQTETQFLWGSALMVAPVLEPNVTKANVYLPPDLWYDLKNHQSFQSNGQTFKMDCPLTDIKLMVRSAHILVTQQPKTTTEETRRGDFETLVALNSEGMANGSLYWDSGDGLHTLLLRDYSLVHFWAQNNTLNSVPKVSGYDISGQKWTKAVILGVKSQPKRVVVNGSDLRSFEFNSPLNRLIIDSINANLLHSNTIQWFF